MQSTDPPAEEQENVFNPNSAFQFISVQNHQGAQDRDFIRKARSHAIRHALRNKRSRLQGLSASGPTLISTKNPSPRDAMDKISALAPLGSPSALSQPSPNPFGTADTTAAGWNAPRMRVLLSNYSARQAAEPVFTVENGVTFQSFRSVFRSGLEDLALLNAVMLAFAFGENGGIMDAECLEYKGEAIKSIAEKIKSPGIAITESIIGAILLIVGVEVRLGRRSQVQIHMSALWQLLAVSKSSQAHLNDAIKRAIFWQDLIASVLTGSTRITDHNTFSELLWTRDPFSANSYVLPPGFQKITFLFSGALIDILKDIRALRVIRDTVQLVCQDTISLLHIDNQQASIQSRLVSLPIAKSDPILEACRLGAMICTSMLCFKTWRTSIVTRHLASRLLAILQQGSELPIWDCHPELLIWLLYIGGAAAGVGPTRSGYIALLHQNHTNRCQTSWASWPSLLEIFTQFIWSKKAFESDVKRFWEEGLAAYGQRQRSGSSDLTLR